MDELFKCGELLTLEGKKTHQKTKFNEGDSGITLIGKSPLKGSESTLPENIDKDLSHWLCC